MAPELWEPGFHIEDIRPLKLKLLVGSNFSLSPSLLLTSSKSKKRPEALEDKFLLLSKFLE